MFSGDGQAGVILNIIPGMQSCGTPPKTWFSLICDDFCVHFSVEPLSNRQFWSHPSWELPCFKTAKHAIYIVFINILDESCGALVLKTLFILYTSAKLRGFLIWCCTFWALFLVSARGSISLGKHIFLESTLGKWRKCQKLNVFWSKSLTLVELRI